MVLSVWTEPDISQVLDADIKLIAAHPDINNNREGTQFLFSDDRYAEQLHDLSLRSHEYRELTGNFDGYTLYNKMSWLRYDKYTALESRGVFTEIPFRGYSGWLCNYN